MPIMPSVYPSGVALASAASPMVPIAPGRFSTTTGCPSCAVSRSARIRATTSGGEPGALGAISLIGRLGYSCAQAIGARAKRSRIPNGRRNFIGAHDSIWVLLIYSFYGGGYNQSGRATMRADDKLARRVKLREMRILLAAAKWGSLAKAAENLGLSQPAISKAIAGLEDTFGGVLLDRTHRGVQPTTQGTVLLQRAM